MKKKKKSNFIINKNISVIGVTPTNNLNTLPKIEEEAESPRRNLVGALQSNYILLSTYE